MAQQLLISCFLVWLALFDFGACHDKYSGKCPRFDAMETFDWDRFSGRWYAMEKFDTDSRCLTYDFEEDEYERREVLQVSEHDMLKKLSVPNKVKYRGQLSFPYSNRESDMVVEFPISSVLFDSASYVVLDTDYDNYGLVCSCQEVKILFGLLTAHRRSCTILQRKPERSTEYASKLHDLVNKQIGDADASHDFDIIQHSKCNYQDDGRGLQIDVNEFLGSAKDQIGRTLGSIIGMAIKEQIAGTLLL